MISGRSATVIWVKYRQKADNQSTHDAHHSIGDNGCLTLIQVRNGITKFVRIIVSLIERLNIVMLRIRKAQLRCGDALNRAIMAA
jgi:hypothetical protein